MPSAPAPALDARSKAWCLVAALACALPLLRLLPASLAASMAALSAMIVLVSWRQPLHLLLRVLLTFTFVALVLGSYHFAIGRASGSALLLAMLLVKPAELTRLRDGRSLVGFALFALFAAMLLDQGPLTLVLALPAAVLAFAACARMADAEVGQLRRRLALQRIGALLGLFALALPLAMAGFWLFPRLGGPLWGLPDATQAKVGIADAMAPGDWLNVLIDDSPALRVDFDGPPPPQQALYWRGLVLWDFDGRAWRQARWPDTLPPALVSASGSPVLYRVSLEPNGKRYLFALDLAQATPEGASMAEDRSLSFNLPVDSLRSYRLSSAPPRAFETELPAAVRAAALQLPRGYDPRTRGLARRWRQQGDDDDAIIRRALAMYHAGFSYSLAAPPLGRDSVDEFLFDTRVGFCEHFSSSFTFLMRAAGIPARVVTGYVGGYWNRVGKFLLVRQSDAHAWSEVWLRGRGWVRIDPTAAVAPERVFRHGGTFNAGGSDGGAGITRLFDVGDWLRYGWNQFVLGFSAARQLSLASALGLPDADRKTLAIVFGVVASVLLLVLGAFQWRDRGPRADPLARAWRVFTHRFERTALRKRSDEPARAWARRIAPRIPVQAPQVLALSERFASARYAPGDADAAAQRRLILDLRSFRLRRPPRP